MNEKNADWNDLKYFLAVARHKGLSGAAREIGTSPATLGRRMLALEQSTGAEIFHRHARGYELTEQGEALLTRVSAVDAAIRPLFPGVGEDRKTLVKLSAGHWTLHALSRHVDDIRHAAPDAHLRLISATDYLKINHREAAIGIRNQRPEQAGLACRKIGVVTFAGYAASDAVTGWIQVASKAPSARWLAARSHMRKVIEANAPRLAKDLALQGIGRVILPCFIGDNSPGLVRVHPQIPELEHDQWLVSHDEDRFIPTVRRVLDATYRAMTLIVNRVAEKSGIDP